MTSTAAGESRNGEENPSLGHACLSEDTFHGLEGINYPEHFWKALVENEREKLISP